MVTFQMKNIAAGLSKNKRPLKVKEQGLVFTRLSELLDNGFTLGESLDFLGKMQNSHSDIFIKMLDELKSGLSVHQVFYNKRFDQQACAQLYFAEKHGYLAEALKESGQYLLRKEKERRKLLRLLQYPFILVLVLLIVGILLKTLLLPRFHMLYDSMGYEPSFTIKWFLHFMQSVPVYIASLLLLVLLMSSIIPKLLNNKSALQKSALYSSIPIIGEFYRLYQTIFLAREWSFLLKSGFSINEVIEVMNSQPFRPLLKETANEIRSMLKLGYSFSDALANLGFLEKDMIAIVTHGEKNGRLDRELLFYSHYCLQRIEEKTMKMFVALQPAIFLLIGLVVIAIYLSIFLPMFQMMDAI